MPFFHQIWVPHMNVETSSGGVKTRKPFRLRSNYVLVFSTLEFGFKFDWKYIFFNGSPTSSNILFSGVFSYRNFEGVQTFRSPPALA